jgi:hypothetical protein
MKTGTRFGDTITLILPFGALLWAGLAVHGGPRELLTAVNAVLRDLFLLLGEALRGALSL